LAEPLTILVAARDEEQRIEATVAALRAAFPEAEVIVADDGSRDGTADAAERAGATCLRLPRRGKGQALSAAERAAPPGRLLLADADLAGDLRPLVESGGDLAIAAFARPGAGKRGVGSTEPRMSEGGGVHAAGAGKSGGFGIAKRTGRVLVRALAGFEAREPLSGQRALSQRARTAAFPLAPGFGCEVRGTIDVVRAGLDVREVELEFDHRATGRDLGGFVHRAHQLHDALLACLPLRVNHRGTRLPLLGAVLAVHTPVALVGLADDLWSGPERGIRAHLRAGRTTGVLKAIGIPLLGLARTRSLSGALAVALAANFWNQLDTRPGRALKAYLAVAPAAGAPLGLAVLLAPYDLREMGMLGDGGSNALGAMVGLSSVSHLGARSRWSLVGALAALNLLGETRSLHELIERTPVIRDLDAWGRLR
jgi:glucosyl-3-phosphoglycerate synthase